MGFKAKRGAAKLIANDVQMKRYMDNIADVAAKEVSRRAPQMVKDNGRIDGRTSRSRDGWQAEVAVKSPWWHWPEFGTSGRHFRTAQPYIRPGAQSVISRIGGRWKTN